MLILNSTIRQALQREAESAYPQECCGMLIGREERAADEVRRVVDRLFPMENTFAESERYHRFTIDPKQQIEAEKQADAEGRMVLGYYHSHPDHPAQPSEYDRTHMPPWEFYSQVIVSVAAGVIADLRSWRLVDDAARFDEETVG